MPTGLIRRGARYSVRRRIPLDLVEHYGRQELTRALGTADPKEARKHLPLVWAALDIEFDQARAALNVEAATPSLDVDPALVAGKMLANLRLKREKAAVDGTLEALTQYMRDQLLNHQAVLDGAEEPSWSLARHEGIRNGLRAALTGEGAMSIQDTRRAREKRRDFDLPALEAIFGGSVYAGGERPQAGAGEAAYWIPLLALYTGARINELCQLHPGDVVQEAYVDAKGVSRSAWGERHAQNNRRPGLSSYRIHGVELPTRDHRRGGCER